MSAEVDSGGIGGTCIDVGHDGVSSVPQVEARYYEIGVDDLVGPVSVKGRLRAKLSFWKEELGASPAVLKIIEAGYVLPLMSEPTPFFWDKPVVSITKHRVCRPAR